MTRLPLNSLVWLLALGLFGASAWQFTQAYKERKANEEQLAEKTAKEVFDTRIELGKSKAGKVAVGPNYAEPKAFWDAVKSANFNGKEPPKPVEQTPVNPVDSQPVAPTKTPLDDIFVISLLVADGPESRVVVRYRPAANVTPPADAVPPATALDSVPSPAAAGGARPIAMPTAGDGLGPVQHLMIGDHLWRPYENIKLKRVDQSGDFAVFVREDPKVEEAKWEEEKLYKAVLELPQSVIQKLIEIGAANQSEVRRPEDGSHPEVTSQASGWIAGSETRQIDGRIYIGTGDADRFNRDSSLFTEQFGTQSYRSSYGGMTGVRITRVPSELRSYGVQENDIVIAVNGEKVAGKPEALALGRRLYDRGVRNFEVRILRQGSETTLTYVVPERR
ncbi:MAG: hypothetical protein U1F36_04155 [Planctomycetota bacterium]